MAKLEQLRTFLDRAQNTAGTALGFADDAFPDEMVEVKTFFAEVLSATTLDIEQIDEVPLIDTSEPGQITVHGKAAVFNSPGAELTLVFSEGENEKLGYETAAAIPEGIPIGQLAAGVSAFEGVAIPAAVEESIVTELSAGYEPGAAISFGLATELPTSSKPLNINVLLKANKEADEQWGKSLESVLMVGDFVFELSFGIGEGAKNFTATLRPGELGEANLTDVLSRFVELPDGLAPDLTIALENAFISFSKPDDPALKSSLLFGVSVGTGMSFGSSIPLVGPMLNGQSIGVEEVVFTYATTKLKVPDLQKLNLHLPVGKPKLLEVDLSGGIGFSMSMAFGKLKQLIALPLSEEAEEGSDEAEPLTEPEKKGKWFAVNKRMGPLSIAKVGVNFSEGVLSFGLEASLSMGPLTLALEELTIGSPLDRFEPRFGLHGFGIGWSGGPVEISGFFLRQIVEVDGVETDNFVGAALIKTPTLTLKAVGEFAMVQGNPSFYLYAYLGYPIGGPAFFFVEGLAAGFGFNRSVRVPETSEVKTFPLVAIALGEEKFLTVAMRMAEGNYVPIDIGKLFLAVGIRFNTFKQLDSFILLIATIGDSFRLDLLGLSKLTVPAPLPGASAPPLAEIELAIKGTFAPAEGFVGVQAQLTKNSYILSRDCYLTGGFAFFTWFEGSEYEGDFVITLGGYHPKFKRPGHYPVVPRLGFNWQVSSTINVKGGMYFALTPTVLMAGGRLEATFRSGGLKAWFIIGADFIIGWQPYSYDARMYLSLGVSYTFWFFGKQTISLDIGADLHIWGPEFSGTAYIDLGIVDFTVEFGAGNSQSVKPIRWSEFEKTFLPPAKDLATVSVANGLLKEVEFDGENIWVVNPKKFALLTDSVIPSNAVSGYLENEGMSLPEEIGIGTVGVKFGELSTVHSVKIEKGGKDISDKFVYRSRKKSYPAALWGEKLKPDKNETERVLKNLLSGVTIEARRPVEVDQMGYIDQAAFQFQTETKEGAFAFPDQFPSLKIEMTESQKEDEALTQVFLRSEINDSLAEGTEIREGLLAALGYEPSDFELDENADFGFTEAPVVGVYLVPGLVA